MISSASSYPGTSRGGELGATMVSESGLPVECPPVRVSAGGVRVRRWGVRAARGRRSGGRTWAISFSGWHQTNAAVLPTPAPASGAVPGADRRH